MSEWDGSEIDYLSSLCRIECTEEEKKTISENLTKILSYMDLLEELDTTNVTPCSQVIAGMANVMQEDVEKPCWDREEFLKMAPDKVSGLIKIPTVIKSEE